MTPSVAVTIKGAYNMVPAFGGATWKSNYQGHQISIGVGWVFGRS